MTRLPSASRLPTVLSAHSNSHECFSSRRKLSRPLSSAPECQTLGPAPNRWLFDPSVAFLGWGRAQVYVGPNRRNQPVTSHNRLPPVVWSVPVGVVRRWADRCEHTVAGAGLRQSKVRVLERGCHVLRRRAARPTAFPVTARKSFPHPMKILKNPSVILVAMRKPLECLLLLKIRKLSPCNRRFSFRYS